MSELAFRPLDPLADLELVHGWMQQPHVVPWWELAGPVEVVEAHLAAQAALAHVQTWIVTRDGMPSAYVETYRAADDPLAAYYDARPGDRGFHVLLGPPELLRRGIGQAVVRATVQRLLGEEGAVRVVCEPDVRNARMLACCHAVGAVELGGLELPGRRAVLLGWTRARRDSRREHDVVGVGIGPFNLGLAALLDGVPDVDAAFFDARDAFAWHPGLLLDDAEVQVPFLGDLVTLADPTSPHSFLAYLHACGRLYRFYFHERWHASRREFDAYYRWVAERLGSVRFGATVQDVRPRAGGGWTVVLAGGEEHDARAVVLGVGSVPHVPACARPELGERVLHTSAYAFARERALAARRVTVVGSGQSAAEVVADLLDHAPGAQVAWFTRGPGFLPMEYSKLGLEHFSPEYTAHFHGLPAARRDMLRAGQDLLYKGISAGTSERIYDALYRRSIDGAQPDVGYAARCELRTLGRAPDGALRLGLQHLDEDVSFRHETDVLVLGTGYRLAAPPVSRLAELAELDERGRPVIEADYRVRLRDGSESTLFVQHSDLHSHGVGAPDLGLGAHRNAVIVNALCGREVYRLRGRNVFQTFGVPPGAEAQAPAEAEAPVRAAAPAGPDAPAGAEAPAGANARAAAEEPGGADAPAGAEAPAGAQDGGPSRSSGVAA